jgi:hypothetical protein
MANRIEDTRTIRGKDTRAGGLTVAAAADTAEERTAAMTAGETPSRGRCLARLQPDAL